MYENQCSIPFYLNAALARNLGSEVTTHLAPYEKRQPNGRRYYTAAELRRADGSLIHRASASSESMALINLDTALSLR